MSPLAPRTVRIIVLTFLAVTLLFPKGSCAVPASAEGPYRALPGLIDLRTTWSDGTHSVEELAGLARSRGFKVLFITDHDRIDLSYGLPPFRNILRYKKSYPSIMTHGPERYLADIRRVSALYPDMILIPGCESSAYYYWTGSWFKKNLTLNEYDRRILILNFDQPEDYSLTPNLGNRLSLKYTTRLLPGSILFLLPLALGAVLLKWKGRYRKAGLLIMVFSLLALIDYNPFRSSLFSPYRGDQGIAPYQRLIDYVNRRGGFSFWNYPEQLSGIRKHGPIYVNTPPYPQVLHQSRNYTGFSGIYGDRMTLTKPGKAWDRVLNEYCDGLRQGPPWVIATSDFHEDGRLGLKLGTFVTTFLVKDFSKAGVLEALKRGRMYCSRGNGRAWPKLERFTVTGDRGETAAMGETLVSTVPPLIRFRVSFADEKPGTLTLLLIRGGDLIRTFEGDPPFDVEWTDEDLTPGEKTFYRIMDAGNRLTSNPVFVTYTPPGKRS